MAAREDETQSLVGDRAHLFLLVGPKLLESGEQLGLAGERPFAPDPIDRAVARRRDDPRAWIARGAVPRPTFERGRERVLNRVLRELEVTEDADEDRNGTSPLLAEDRVDGYWPASGRISTDPLAATGTRSASSIAWSRSLHSARK